jgi:hypothetical protein
MRYLVARFPGICRRCNKKIRRGQQIIHLQPKLSVHRDCDEGKSKLGVLQGSVRPATRRALEQCERAGFR